MDDENLFNELSKYVYFTIGKIDEGIKKIEEYNEQLQIIQETIDLNKELKEAQIDLKDIAKSPKELNAMKDFPTLIKRNLVSILGNMEYDQAQFSSSVADIREYAANLKKFKYSSRFDDLKKSMDQELKEYEKEKLATRLSVNLIIDKLSEDRVAEKYNTGIRECLK